jgi:FMN phosphatase YigB (HAD superfamily)
MIVVDLDDTLIDTRSTLRVRRLIDAARLDPRIENYVLARARERIRGRDLIRDACALFDVDAQTESMMIAAYYETLEDVDVPLIEGASQALETFRTIGERIVCVTHGIEERQRSKISASGLDVLLDEVIVVSQPQDKELVYADLSAQQDPASIIVIGDRLTDVVPAQQLGMHAIFFGLPLDAWDGLNATGWAGVLAIVSSLLAMRV